MAQPTEYVYSGAFIPGSLARAEQVGIEFTSVQQGFAALAIQGVDTGTANTYVVATSGGKDGVYSDGLIVEFKAANTCTGGSTISVDSGAVVGLTNQAGQSLAAGAITAGTWYLCRYNSTYSAFTIIAPTPATVTIGTISGAPPTHLVGLVAAAGVSLAAAPIDVTFALDQTISPTMTGSWTFAGTVAFNSTVTFASGFTLTGASGAYTITLDGSAVTGNSYGVKIAAGTNGADIAFLITSQGGTTFFTVAGTGGITVGTPTGGSQGLGTINATGLFVNGAAVKTTSISSANPSAVIGLSAVNGSALTFMTSDSAPALSQAIAPTMTGKWIFTPSSAVTAVTINAAINAVGLAIVGGTNTVNTYLMTLATGAGAGFSSGLYVSAGTSSADTAINILNAAATLDYFTVRGDGSGVLGYGNSENVLSWTTTGAVTINPSSSATPTAVVQDSGAGALELSGTANSQNVLLRLIDGQSGGKEWRLYNGFNSAGQLSFYDVGASVTKFRLIQGTTAPLIQGYGPTAAALVDMTPDTGSFTITYTGMTASVTGTAVWVRIGGLVMLYLPAATGTSNSTSFTATGLPAVIQPARSQVAAAYSGGDGAAGCFTSGGTPTGASCSLAASSGIITFGFVGPTGITSWNSSASVKGINTAFTIAYIIV
jgi:hypothetical protein